MSTIQGNHYRVTARLFPPSAKSMQVLHQNLYCSSFALGTTGQVKMIRRCFPIKQNHQCFWCAPERQNFNAPQTQSGKSAYSRTKRTGSPRQPTRSSGHICAVQSTGFSNTVGAHSPPHQGLTRYIPPPP